MVAVQRSSSAKMSHSWTIAERHCLHILATHYPDSTWVDRAAVFNRVFSSNMTHQQIRDEYGGHKAGQRNQPGGKKPTRSVQWNDHVCRDAFRIAGGFNATQQTDRRNMLQSIQTAINALGLTGNDGLGAISMVTGIIRADTNVVATAAAVAPGLNAPFPAPAAAGPSAAAPPTGQPAATSASAPAGNTAANDSHDTEADDDNEETDPARGARDFYHVRELQRQVGSDVFLYRPVDGTPYDVEPAGTFERTVRFPGDLVLRVDVCDFSKCSVCRMRGG